ncbi:hypothetical protein ONZ45_g10661 [Pleurotus djamor]|nr:hypothetical protein ONZ45_g10661 [Pleurotus djamor]
MSSLTPVLELVSENIPWSWRMLPTAADKTQYILMIRHDTFQVPVYEVSTNCDISIAEHRIRYYIKHFAQALNICDAPFAGKNAKKYRFWCDTDHILIIADGKENDNNATLCYMEITLQSPA